MKSFRLKLAMVFILGISGGVFAQSTPHDTLSESVKKLQSELGFLKNLKVSGWIQAQFQVAEWKGAKTFDGGDFLPNSNSRFMIRRGRVKFTYTYKWSEYVFQLNASERGVNIADAYVKLNDPWTKAFSISAGVMNRPYGFEIEQSSSVRETPERSRFVQILMANERDIGAKVSFQPTKGKKLYGFRVEAGFFNGTGIAVPGTSPSFAWVTDFDSFKDFIGKIRYERTTKSEKIKFGVGASHYNGGFYYSSNKVYKDIVTDVNGEKVWQLSDTTTAAYKGNKAPRMYIGGDFQFAIKTKLGTTSLRGEYLTGTQSGTASSTKSPTALPTGAIYVRPISAAYAYFIHRFGKSKHEIAVKYEWYDPNTKVNGQDLTGLNGMTDGELKYQMLGLGYNFYAHENVLFMFHYNMVQNENAKGLAGFTRDLKDNVFTIRMQYKF